jgi:protein TonB
MPEGLLGGVPDCNRAGRHWSILPLSVAAHAIAAGAIIVIPLAAEVEPPTPHRDVPEYMRAMATPAVAVPPPAGSRRGAAPAPSVAADTIAAPPDVEPAMTGSGTDPGPVPPGVPMGAIGGVGQIGEVVSTGPPPLPAPQTPAVRRLIPVGSGISPPRKTHHVPPTYPAIARNARVEGTVLLEAVINERGGIERLKVLRSVPLLDTAAIEAVSQWRYTPTLLNNVPVPVLMTITVRFSLRE